MARRKVECFDSEAPTYRALTLRGQYNDYLRFCKKYYPYEPIETFEQFAEITYTELNAQIDMVLA